MKKLILLSFLLVSFLFKSEKIFSQVPTTCFEITRLMVDACGSEPDNEMIYFTVGPNPLNVSTLTITWPSNPFLGMVQDATTAGNVAGVNATITSCGHVLEPVGGVLPAGKKVILVTSTNMSVGAYSFANLTDTVYMIFQNFGASSGHLKNYQAGAGPRTVMLSFGAGCSDAVTYMVDSLINQSGVHAAQDGATVYFDFAGNATAYTNPGCQEVVIPVTDTVTAASYSVCPGASLAVSGIVNTGNYLSTFWYGGQGTFLSPTSQNTVYQTDAVFLGTDQLIFAVIGNCNDTLRDTLNITISASASVNINASGPTTICTGSSVTLTASGATTYVWAPGGETTASINVTTAGTYSVTGTGSCGVSSASQSVVVLPGSAVSIAVSGSTTLCQGDSVALTASGGGPYLWSTGATNPLIYVDTAGIFTVAQNAACGLTSASDTITVSPVIPIVIAASGPTSFCQGGLVTLTATGGGPYSWSTGSTDLSIVVSTSGHITLTGNSVCASDTSSLNVNVIPKPSATIVKSQGALCPSGNMVLAASATSAGNYVWSTGATTDSIQIGSSGMYSLTASNVCGTSKDSVTISQSNLVVGYSEISDKGPAPLVLDITNTSENANSYLWSFGDNAVSSDSKPSHSLAHGGTYLVSLTGTDQNGCSVTYSHTFVVTEETTLVTPNIFTPNNDGFNDVFTISGSAITAIDGKIYSRWGNEIFSWTSLTDGWNGKTKSGELCSDGTYMYIVSVVLANGEKQVLKGILTLGK